MYIFLTIYIHLYIHTLPRTNSSHLPAFPRRNVVFQASTHLVEAWVRGAVAPKEPLKDVDGGDKNTGGFLGVWKNKFIFAIVVKTWIDNIYIMFTKILYIYVYFSFIVCFFTIFYRPVLIRVHWVREQPLICHLLSSHGCQTLTGLRQLLHADRRRASKWVAPSERWTQLMGFYLHLQEAWHESLAKRETTNEWMNE